MKRLSIGIAIDSLHRVGGTQRSTYEIAERLAKDHDVTVVAKSFTDCDHAPFKCHKIEGCVGWPYIGQLIFAWQASRLKAKLKFDVLNVQGSNGLWADVVTAQSVHKKWYLWSLGDTPAGSQAWWLKILNPVHYVVIFIELMQYKAGLAKRVIAISNQVRRDLLSEFGMDSRTIDVVHHGVNIAEFDPSSRMDDRRWLLERLKIRDDAVIILFVAHEFRRKGLRILLEALALCDEVFHLVVIGKDDPEPFMNLAIDLTISERVFFVGSQSNLGRWNCGSDVFAFPTSYEAFGMVITEAMAAGLPVIVPRDAGASELIEHGVSGILLEAWDDVHALHKALVACKEPIYRRTIGDAARKSALSRTWDDCAKETLDVLKKACEK